MSDSADPARDSPDDLSAELDRLNKAFWAATVKHAGCPADSVLITLMGGLLCIARLDGPGSHVALSTLRDAVRKVTGDEG